MRKEAAYEHRRRRRQRKHHSPGYLRRHAERNRWSAQARHVHDVDDRFSAGQASPYRGGQRNDLQDGHRGHKGQQNERQKAALRRCARQHQVEPDEQHRQARDLDSCEAERIGLAGAAEQGRGDQQQKCAGEHRCLDLVGRVPGIAPGFQPVLSDKPAAFRRLAAEPAEAPAVAATAAAVFLSDVRTSRWHREPLAPARLVACIACHSLSPNAACGPHVGVFVTHEGGRRYGRRPDEDTDMRKIAVIRQAAATDTRQAIQAVGRLLTRWLPRI